MKTVFTFFLICYLFLSFSCSEAPIVYIQKSDEGHILMVEDNPFMVKGMNWDYFPRGKTYTYSLWNESEDFIKKALDYEMNMLKAIGVNAIRVYTGIPPNWIEYIYEEYGIYTMLNHSFGRYGLNIDGIDMENTDYGHPIVWDFLLSEVKAIAKEYKETPGLLMYLLGNENNYGLVWEGAETEDIPVESKSTRNKATALYRLFNEASLALKSIDKNHPVALCNGDLMYLDLIAQHCPDIDIYGTNMYRGSSFGNAFKRVKSEYGKPILFTEFGADAYNVKTKKEDPQPQAYYVMMNWKEIFVNAAFLGLEGNSIGGFTFQFSDGWWKYNQKTMLDIHNTDASWSNGGYTNDYTIGKNNMNEEWFGVCAKGPTNEKGFYKLIPRKSYQVLGEINKIEVYRPGASASSIESSFKKINLTN